MALETELENVKVKGKDPEGKKAEAKRQRILQKWLPEANKKASNSGTSGFRDPASRS